MTSSTVDPLPAARGSARIMRLPTLEPTTVLLTAAVLLGGNGIVVAYRMAEDSDGQAHFAVFWLSYALVLLGALALLLRVRSSAARLGTLAAFGALTFVPKLLMTLDGPRYFDEYGHWRHLNDMVSGRSLFVDTPYLPIQRHYPGLQAMTAAVHALTRLGTWHAGQVVVLAGHVGVLLVIWWMARQLDLSSRAAAIVAVLYALNANFLYFDTQYSYESLGLPLCFTAVALAIGARRARTTERAWWCAAGGLLSAAACVVTHHNSAFVMAVLLLVVALAVPSREDGRSASVRAPWVVAVAALLFLAVWLTAVAHGTYGYVEPHVRSGLSDTFNFLRGKSTRRSGGREIETRRGVFGGSGLPIYEIAFGVLAPLVALGALAFGLLRFRRDRRAAVAHLRLFAPFYALFLLYLVSLPLVLAASGAETAHRAWGFAYLGVAVLLVATGDRWLELARRVPAKRAAVVALAALLVVAIGNTAAGQNIYYRFPGPDTFGTDTRSRTAELDRLTGWIDHNLPAGAKVISDRFTSEALIGYTELRVPTPSDYLVYRIFREGGRPTPRLRAYLRDHEFRYFVLDRRIGHDEPKQKLFQGYYGDQSVSPAALNTAGRTPFLRVVHRTPTYLVLRIRP